MGRRIFFLLMIFSVAEGLRAAPIEASHPVYALLRRLAMQGVIASPRLGSLPRPQEEVAALLDSAMAHADRLQPWEIERIKVFREELDLGPRGTERFHPLAYGDSTAEVRAHLEYFTGGYAQDSLPRARDFAFGSLNATVAGEYHERLQFISTAGLGKEISEVPRFTENYNPQRGLPYNTDREGKAGIPRNVSTMDDFRTVVGYRDENLRLEAGSDWNQWGPGIWQHAFISQTPWFWVQDSLPPGDSARFAGTPYPGRYRRGYRYPGEAAPMTQMRLGFHLGWFDYTKIVAERVGLWNDSAAHLVAHRLEAHPSPAWTVGVEELVATAGRPMDWTYVIPLLPLKYAEHQLGDRDNAAIGADAEYVWRGHGRVFGELFLDDFSGWDLDFWGDKYAFSVGAEAVDLPFAGSLIQAEYARVEPWVFTHMSVDGQLQHFGALIGSDLPPDSHALRLAYEQPVGVTSELRMEYMFMQRDALSRGSSVFDWHDNAVDGTRKVFLGGVVETRNAVSLGGAWRWRRFVELRADAGWLFVENWKSLAGKNLSTPSASGEIRLHY